MRLPLVLLLAAAALTGCGDATSDGSDDVRLRVSAATSLKVAFTAYGPALRGADVSFSFAGSDQLAGQIRSGVRPDVFAAANAELPQALHAEGLVERPVAFARNRLVLAVPADGSRVTDVGDLDAPGVRLAIGAQGVPIGDYARAVIGRLGPASAAAILARVRSEEPDVGGIVGKVAAGAVDAGFVYATDVKAAGGRLRALALPDRLQPEVVYAAAVVRGASQPAAGRAFISGLRGGAGAAALRSAGFLPVP
ncbi:molybdate ABC transporter substrate-binding protein [Paraconexibacter sp.]|uniref:molybdate ABC transporter substrate-binding protein n=1 Tax=Paraconexibacter sp. TaxID=2949640 RepID=UPI0035629209